MDNFPPGYTQVYQEEQNEIHHKLINNPTPTITALAHHIKIKQTIMTSRDFCYWLQGYFEVQSPIEIGRIETELIKKHLALVFKHEIDPSMGNEEHQQELNKIHSPKPPSKDVVYRC